MRIAYMPFGVTRPLLDEFCRTPTTKHASERAYTTSLLYPYGKAFYNHGQKRSKLSKKEQAITGTGCRNGIKKGEKEKSSAWERGAGDLTSINNLTLIESYHDGNDLSGIGLAFVYNKYFTAIYALRL